MKYTNKTLRTSRTLRETFVSAVIAMTAAIAINTAWAEENAADSFWAGPGGVGDWGGPNWYYTLRNGNSYFTEGKTAYFTNETSVIDLGGRTFDVYTLRNPLANGERVSVTVTNGTISIGYPVASSDGDDNYNLKNFDLVGGAGANIVNTFATSGFQLLRSSGITLKDGGTLTETSSDQSTMRFNVGYNGENGSSNYLYVAKGSSLDIGRTIQIGGSNSETLHPTGVVEVAGGSLSALAIWVAYVDGASASGGYGALIVKDGGQVVSRSQFLMGTDYVNGNDIYRSVSEVVVTGEGSSLEIGTPQNDYNLTVREYGTKNILVDNGGRLTVYGNIRNYADNANIHAFDIMVGNGGVLEFKNISFSNHDSTRMDMKGQGKCSLTVDGGTTRALASFTTLTEGADGALHAVTVGENGWTFDTQNFDVIWKRTINFGTGTFTKIGSGFFEFSWVPTFTGTIDVSEGMVGLAGSSAKFPGAITVRSGAAFKKTSAFASEQDASFTLEAGSVLQPYQSSASAAPTAIQAQSFTLPATGTVTIRLGDDGANTAPAGAYPVVTILGEGVFTQADVAKFVCTSGDAVKSFALSADGKSIVLNVGATGACTWIGAAGDGLFSTAANWAGGVKPTAGGTTPLVFAANGGIVTNDIGTLSPAYINFEAALGETGIDIRPKEAEGYGFTALGSVTNSVAYDSVTISAPVVYSAAIDVSALGGKRVLFSGGVTGSAPVNHSYFFGRYTITDAEWTPASNTCIPDGSVLTAKAVLNPNGLQINAGGKLVADSVTDNDGAVGTMTPVFKSNKGEIEIKGLLTLAKPNIFIYNENAIQTGVMKAKGIVISASESSKVWQRLQSWASGSVYYGATFAIGSEGLKFTSDNNTRYHLSASASTENSVTTIYADDDFELAKKSSNTAGDLSMDANAKLVLVTREYGDETAAHTITVNGMITVGGNIEVCGPGTVKFDSSTSTYTGGTTVKDTATLAFGSVSAKPGSGPVTLYAGTTLQIPLPTTSSDAVSLGSALAFFGTGTITLKLGDGTEAIAPGRYNLFTTTSAHAADVLQRFTLANPTEGDVQYNFYGNSGNNTVRLFVGSDTASATPENCLWTGAAGDGKFSTAANWQGGRRPQDVGSTAAVFFNYGGGKVTNDVENLVLSSITFGQNAQLYEICGNPITGVSMIKNNTSFHHIIGVNITCASGTPDLALANSAYVRYDGGIVCEQLADVKAQRYSGKITMTGTTRWTSKTSDISDTQTIDDGAKTVLTVPNVQLNHFTINSGTTVRADQWYKSGNDRNDGNSKPKDYYQLITWINSGKLRVREIKTGGDCRLYTSNGTSSGIIIVDGVLHAVSQASKSYNGTTRYMYVYLHPRAANSSANWAIGANGLGFGTSTACEYYVESGKTANMASFADWHIANNPRSATQLSLAVFGTLNLDTSHYATGEEEGDVPASHTVTLDGYLKSTGTINITGPGKFVINRTTTSDTTGAVNVKDAATLAINAGMKYFGPVNLNGASSFLAPQANTGTAQIGGALTLNSGTSLIVSNLTAGTTALSVGSVTVKGAMLLVEGETPLADGDYTILTAGSDLDASVAGNFSLGGSAVAGKAASLSVDGANLVLTVAGEGLPASPFHVWTGAGADANFSTAANWQSGAAPQAGDGKGIFFQSSSGTLVNDIPGLTPPWITFGAGIGETTITGVNGFTDILAVTNLSTAANATFAVPVAYAAESTIEVDHRAEFNNDTGAYTREKGAVVFAGGVTGKEIRSFQSNGLTSGPHNVYAGQYVRTSDTTFQATKGGSNWRSVIYPGSSLTVKSSTKTGELDIGAGGAFTTGVATITSDNYLNALAYRMGEDSEVVVTERVETSGTGDRMMWRGGSKKAVFKVNGFLQSMTGNWLYLADNNIDEQYGVFYVGPDGFNFSSSSAAGAFALGRDNAASRNTLRPWTNDFTVATRGTSEKDFIFIWNNTICTDDENGIGRKITFNAIPQFSYATGGSVTTISGSGTFEVNSAVVNNASYNVEHIIVTNTATLAFGNSSACLTRGPMTMAAGTTLAVPGGAYGASVTLGSTLSVVGDGKVKLVIGDGSGLAAGDYGVCVVTGGITAEDAAASFALQNATAGVAEFYVVNGAEVRLSVGGKRLSSVWTGAGDGVHFNNAANWSPAFVPENGSELVFPSGSGALVNDISGFAPKTITFGAGIGETTISGNAFSGVLAVTNLSESVQTFSNEVAFAGVYRAYCASAEGFVKFPGGATASYPDASLRTTTGTIASRTLDGNFTFTADWTIGNVGNDNYPWIVASGANVTGKALTGTEERQMFQVDEGGYACFTTVAVGKTKGNISVNGFLEATESISVGVSGQHADFGKSGDTGTVKAPVIKKVDGYSIYCYIPNLIAGSGGIGAAHKDYVWEFKQDTTIVATNDFEFLGVYNSGNAKDWGFGFMGNIVTVDVPEGKSVEFGVSENGSAGVLRKTGAGTLVMSDTFDGQSGFVKAYTGGTTVEGGTLKVLANGMPASGTVTFHAGTTLAVPGDAAVALGTALAFAGEGTVGLVIGDGSTLADGDYPVVSTTATLPEGFAAKFALQNPAESAAMLYSVDGKTLRLAVGNASYTGPKVWTGAAGDGKLATAGNWLGESVPAAGDDIFIDAISAGTIDNDLGIAVKSITFKPTTAPVTITGNGFTGVAAVTNLSTAVQTLSNEVSFASTYRVHCESDTGFVDFAGGATATYPDAAITSDNLASHTLCGDITFTQNWTIPDQSSGKPFVIPAGANVKGKTVAANAYNNANYHLRIENGGTGTFETIAVDGKLVFLLQEGGRLVATGDVTLGGADKRDFGYYNAANSGVLEAHGIYKSVTSYGLIYHYMRNMRVGAGGFGMYRKDYSIQFCAYSRLTATADLAIHQPIAEDVPSDSDWGLNLNGNNFTIDTAGHTVTFDSYVGNGAKDVGGKIIKEGEGEMIMQSRLKRYTGGTEVKGGQLTVKLTGAVGSGPITVSSGATLAVASGVSLPAALTMAGGSTLAVPAGGAGSVGTTFTRSGSGKVNVRIDDGSALEDGDYLVVSVSSGIMCVPEESFALANPNGGNVNFYSTDGKTLRVAVGSYNGPCVWTGEAGDGKFSTAGNWVAGKVPSDGATIVFNAMERSAVENDLGELQIDSVTFGAKCSNVGISGGAFTGVKTVTNLSGTTQFFYVPVVFGNDGDAAIDVTLSSTSAFVGFVGGVKGTTLANHTVYSGKYTLTAAEWSPLASSTLKEYSTIDAKKVLTPPTTALTIEKGAVVDAEEFEALDNGADTRASNKNNGTFKIGTLTASRSAKSDLYLVNDASGTGIFEINKIVQNGTWFFRINSDVAVGEGGLEFNSGDYCITITGNKMYPAAQKVEIKEAEGKSGGYVLLYNAPATFDTTRYGTADEPAEWVFKRPIKYNTTSGYNQPLNITGCGKVTYSAPLADSTMQADVNVNDSATLAISAGCKVTTGAITVAAGATLAAPESGAAAQIAGTCTFATNSTLEFAISGASNSSFAFTSAPTGSATVKFAPGFNPTPGTEFTLATGVGDGCTFTLDPKYGGTLEVDKENGTLVYKARNYFFIRVAEGDSEGLNVNPSWFSEKDVEMESFDDETLGAKLASTAPNGNTYKMNYIFDYNPEDAADTLYFTEGGETEAGWQLGCSFKVNELLKLTGGNLVMKTTLIGSADGKNYSDVEGCTTNIVCEAGKTENVSFDIPLEKLSGGLSFFV